MSAPRTDRRRGLSPAVRGRRDVPLLLLTLAAAGSSIAALLLHAAGVAAMPFAISFVTLPGMVLLLCIAAWAGRTDRDLLLNRLRVGTIGGILGLLAYDAIRLLVSKTIPIGFDAFRSMLAFGHFITGAPESSVEATVAGWAYHLSNGLTFAIAYALVAGPARWWYGLIWGAALQAAMTAVYPKLFVITGIPGFLTVSIIGHAAYGTVTGWWCERHAMASIPVPRGLPPSGPGG